MDLLRAEGRTNCQAFFDKEGYMLLASAIESEFHPILEEIQEHRDRILADSIPSGIDSKENYRCNQNFRRGDKNQALENRLENSVIILS